MSADLLAIYLTDHLAGATAGATRMRRLAEHERAADDGEALAAIADEIEQDRDTLRDILAVAEVSPRWYKAATAWLAEKAGLLKTNGRLIRRSPLTSVVELEVMRMGVTGKLSLWEALSRTELRERFDFERLAKRATAQLDGLQAAHAMRAGVVGQREVE
jgi:hypothetical protein